MNKKITFPELVDAIAELTNTSKRVSEQFLKELFGVIKECLEQGETVKVKGFGVFKVTEIAPRKSVNVNTGEEIEIPSHRRVNFTPDKSLAEAINMPFEGFETVMLDDGLSETELASLANVDDELSQEETDIQPSDVDRIEEEPQPPVFVERDDEGVADSDETIISEDVLEPKSELQKDLEEDTEVLEEDEIAETDAALDDDETKEITDIVVEDYGITYDEEEMKIAKRYSFVWGTLLGLFVATLGFALFYCCVLNTNKVIDNTENLVTEVQDTMMVDVDKQKSEQLQDTLSTKNVNAKRVNEVVTDTVRTNYFLTKMSRKYYGNYVFWVYIYEENKEKIANPNHVAPGLVVVIPPAEKYGIDKDSPESVKKAKEKAENLQ